MLMSASWISSTASGGLYPKHSGSLVPQVRMSGAPNESVGESSRPSRAQSNGFRSFAFTVNRCGKLRFGGASEGCRYHSTSFHSSRKS